MSGSLTGGSEEIHVPKANAPAQRTGALSDCMTAYDQPDIIHSSVIAPLAWREPTQSMQSSMRLLLAPSRGCGTAPESETPLKTQLPSECC